MNLPATSSRVRRFTPEAVNLEIWQQTVSNIESMVNANPEQIEDRLRQLDAEWDIERTLETNAAVFSLIGLGLGTTVNRRWLGLPAVVAGFLLQHALQGWCPPVSIFRRRGVRTQSEIQLERDGLRALRGDFDDLPIRDGNQVKIVATLQRVQRMKGGPTGP